MIVILTGCEQQNQSAPPPAMPTPSAVPDIQPLISQCSQCHHNQHTPPAPFINGQQAHYLGQALSRYRNGERQHEAMNNIAALLNDAQIDALAQHYANTKTTWQGGGIGMTTAVTTPNPRKIAQGKALSPSCAACHGTRGISVRPGVPNLAGLDHDYLVKALAEYVDGTRANDLMFVYKTTLKSNDIQALAAYYSNLPAGIAKTTGNTTPANAKTRRACDGCHGTDGNPLPPGMPRLAGQDETYLAIALTHYRERRRKDDAMQKATATLSDATLKRLAAYYARQTPRTLTTGTIALTTTFDPLGDGKLLASGCDGCHTSGETGIPNLNALSPAYLQQAMTAYQNNQRNHSQMRRFMAPFNELDLEKISLYYASQPPDTLDVPSPADDATLEIAASCNGCHGPNGNSSNDAAPTLAGQNAAYLANALNAYANGERAHDDMTKAATALSPDQIQSLANHYAAQQRDPLTIQTPQPPETIAQKCDRCHGVNGTSDQPDKPRLAGQVEAYLVSALQRYQHGERQHSAMHAMADVLSPLELRAIAAYYANQPSP